MPGFGASEMRADQLTSLDIQGAVFAEMLDLWGLSRPAVIAHDFGGAATLRAHLLHRCDFGRYVLMNVVAMRPWGSAFFNHVGRHLAAFQGLPPHIHKAIVDAYVRGAFINNIEDEDVRRLIGPWLTANGAISFYRQFAQADERYTAEVEPMFGQLRCPVRVLWGENDPWIPVERGQALHALIGKGRFETLVGVGHLPQLEAPEAMLTALSDFFDL